MSNTIQVTIQPADVELGRPNSCQWCPLAMALRRQLKARWVSVGMTNVFVIREETDSFETDPPVEVELYDLPAKAQRWIRDFDDGQRVPTAITFSLNRPWTRFTLRDDEYTDLRNDGDPQLDLRRLA